MKHIPVIILFFFSLAGAAHAAYLPDTVVEALRQARIPLSGVSVVVRETHGGDDIISLNAERAMNPASTMKLLTTFSALETLGPGYRWKTEVYLDGPLEKGVLKGNLVFKGYGDPKFTIEQFWLWLHELRQRGLREIRGDLVLDSSFFEALSHNPAEFDNDPNRAYNVGPNALLLNFNALHLRLIPNGKATKALLEPDLAGYTVKNRIKTSAKLRCHGADAYTARIAGKNIVLEGLIPRGCGEVDDYFSLLPHDKYFYAVFGALWQELGGTFKGKLRTGVAPSDQEPFATHWSSQLSEVIRDINKFSNNTMARQLFLTMGTKESAQTPVPPQIEGVVSREGADTSAACSRDCATDSRGETDAVSASTARSTAVVQQWLASQQMTFPELVLENGAGLSRKERISAQHLADILRHSAHGIYSAELEASLPILGMDGTVKKRFKDSEIAGHAHLKTGTLDGVKSMAGYIHGQSGKQLIVVFIINHANAAQGQAAQDALIEWLEKAH